MTEDFLLRQAAAELLVIEQGHAQSPDPQSALSAALWNWFSEYGRQSSPQALVRMASMVGDHLAGKTDFPGEFFDAAREAVQEYRK